MRKVCWLALAVALVSFLSVSCADEAQEDGQSQEAEKVLPDFSADSAYSYVEKQCSFGPRVPGTEAHEACLEWFVEFFKANGADSVIVQNGEMKLYNGSIKPVRNVVAVYDIENENRVMLCSHWDSRPFADNEANPDERRKAIQGADDGASGVGVLMEIARIINNVKPSEGVDIVLFDLEDWGAPDWEAKANGDNGWCLGSMYWAQHTHFPGYRAQYGVLLDMVGGSDDVFYREYFSETNVKWLNDKVWSTAKSAGLESRFVDKNGGAITDDHISVLRYAGIPCIDIVAYNPETETGFPEYWHTQKDDMRNISQSTLADVGKLLLMLLY